MAAEPLTRIQHRETHEWRFDDWQKDGWTLHYLPGPTPHIPLRHANEHEEALLNECKRLVEEARAVPVKSAANGVTMPDVQTKPLADASPQKPEDGGQHG